MSIEKSPADKLEDMGLVRGALDEDGSEIDPGRIALLKKVRDLRNEVQADLAQVSGVLQGEGQISEEAKKVAQELIERLKNA